MTKSFSELINSTVPTLVDFFATWCGPCKAMAPELQKLKSAIGDKANVLKVDIDKNPAVAHIYGVKAVPTVILFKDGKIVWRQSGVVSAQQLQQVIGQHV